MTKRRTRKPVKRLVASHTYSNKARIAIYRVAHWPGVRREDILLMQLTTARGKVIGAHMRADEAILLASKLLTGVWKAVEAYRPDPALTRR